MDAQTPCCWRAYEWQGQTAPHPSASLRLCCHTCAAIPSTLTSTADYPSCWLTQRASQVLPEASALDSAFVGPSTLDSVEAAAQEALAHNSWVDVQQVVPSALSPVDISTLLAQCPTVQGLGAPLPGVLRPASYRAAFSAQPGANPGRAMEHVHRLHVNILMPPLE